MVYHDDNLKLLLDLVSIQSDTGTVLEQKVEEYIYDYLKEMPYLKSHGSLGLSQIHNDPKGRAVVWGLVKGKGKETIILLNHHDVVDSNDYGNLQKYAYQPDALKAELKTIPQPDDVTKDLESEGWLFGRGTADMKGGLAIQLNLLRKYSNNENFNGNLLFLSVPDEESLSLGMRHSAQLIVDLMKKYDLSYKLLINSEPHEREYGHYTIYDGSVGKTMATVYVQGKKTHIGKIFEGLNPSLILSKIVMHTEVNSQFSDRDLGEISPPPSWSFMRDFKDCYDASVPEAAGGYISFLTLSKSPKELLDSLKNISIQSFEETVEHIQREYKKLYPDKQEIPDYKPNVKLYEELLADAKVKNASATEKALRSSFEDIRTRLDKGTITMPESNFIIIKALMHIAAYNVPTVVIALSPPFYPHVSSEKNEANIAIIDEIMKCTMEFGIKKAHYFMGISDLSYVGLQNAQDVIPYVEPNMPLWREDFYTIPFEVMKIISTPSVIIGPWGKDIHKMTERIYIPDLVKHTPLLIEKLIETLLDEKIPKETVLIAL
jgi:arginine utilization protein RocB